ncbi:MAG: hypothetical protein ABIT05_09845 [Chitinophagaceae bacterium]
MGKLLLFILLLSLLSCGKNAGDTTFMPARDGVYSNGNLGTGNISNSGVAAPAGFNWSELQNNPGENITNYILGITCSRAGLGNYHVADDFTIPAGQTWKISRFSIYAYQDNMAGPVSPFDSLRIQVWNKKPQQTGAAIIFGNLTSNVLSSSIDSFTYVIENSTVPAPGITPYYIDRVWKLSANVDLTLQAGTYWLDWQTHTSGNYYNYTPTVKVKGTRGLPGWNAIVFNALNVWQDVRDYGRTASGPTPPIINQDLPFEIVYKY